VLRSKVQRRRGTPVKNYVLWSFPPHIRGRKSNHRSHEPGPRRFDAWSSIRSPDPLPAAVRLCVSSTVCTAGCGPVRSPQCGCRAVRVQLFWPAPQRGPAAERGRGRGRRAARHVRGDTRPDCFAQSSRPESASLDGPSRRPSVPDGPEPGRDRIIALN
jgi:hypothetical protein